MTAAKTKMFNADSSSQARDLATQYTIGTDELVSPKVATTTLMHNIGGMNISSAEAELPDTREGGDHGTALGDGTPTQLVVI